MRKFKNDEEKLLFKNDVRTRMMRGERVEDEEKEWLEQEYAELLEEQKAISEDTEKPLKQKEIKLILRQKGMDTQQVEQAAAMIDTVVWGW